MSYKSKYRMYDALHSGLDKGIQIGGQLGLQTLMSMNRRKEAEEEAARNAPRAAEELRAMGLQNKLRELELQNAPEAAELTRRRLLASATQAETEAAIGQATKDAVIAGQKAKSAAFVYSNNVDRLQQLDELDRQAKRAQIAGNWAQVRAFRQKADALNDAIKAAVPEKDKNDYESGMSRLKADPAARKEFQKAYLETREKADMTNRLLKTMSEVAQDESKFNKVKRLLGSKSLTFAGLLNGLEQQGFKNLASELMIFSRGRLQAEPNAVSAQEAVATMFQAGPLAGRGAWMAAMNNLAATMKSDISGKLEVVQSGFAPGSKRRDKYSSADNLIRVPSFAEKYARDGRLLKSAGSGEAPRKQVYEGLDVRGVR